MASLLPSVCLVVLAYITLVSTQSSGTPHHEQAMQNPPFKTNWFTRACEGQTLIFYCEQERLIKLDLSSIFWGRIDQDACTGDGLDTNTTTCSMDSSTSLSAIEACDGEVGGCSVEITPENLQSDPCPSIHKVFEMSYSCELPAGAAYICEDEEMELQCPGNQVIKVYDAFYGRDTEALCNPENTDLPTGCSASPGDIVSKLAAICDGLSSCVVRVNNAYLGDPCSGVSKYLSVNYVCGVCENSHESTESCTNWANDGECEQNVGWMNSKCTKACWGCGTRNTDCGDNQDDCSYWASRGECQLNMEYMSETCAKSCGTCDSGPDFVGQEGVDYSAEVCEGRWVQTMCGDSGLVLHITDIFYGRDDDTTCVDGGAVDNTNCPSPAGMLAKAQELCDGRESCYLGADSVWQWEDPCPGTSKYLRLTHQCRKCENVLNAATCENLKASGQCAANKAYMMTNCFATCTGCEYSDCPNMHSSDQDCDSWAPAGECDDNPDFMLEWCKRSCRACSADPNVDDTCINRSGTTSCEWWASNDECLKNPRWMKLNCEKACDLCDEDACVNNDLNCVFWASLGECTNNAGYMSRYCKKACTDCSGDAGSCVNAMGTGKLCDEWAAEGACQSNPNFMNPSCNKACNCG